MNYICKKAMSKTISLFHIVFCTKNRCQVIPLSQRAPLFRFIWHIIQEKKCILYRINGMGEHIHILIDLHPTCALSDFVREIKSKSSQWMRKSGFYPLFDGWGREYFAESKSPADKDTVINYIKAQEIHHTGYTFAEEVYSLITETGMTCREDDLS